MAATPETSEHTSVKQRCEQAKTTQQPNRVNQQVKKLYPFVGNPKDDQPQGIQMRLTDYLELVDCTGRILRGDKRGAISANAESALKRLDIDEDNWMQMTQHFEKKFSLLFNLKRAGGEFRMKEACTLLHYKRTPGPPVTGKPGRRQLG